MTRTVPTSNWTPRANVWASYSYLLDRAWNFILNRAWDNIIVRDANWDILLPTWTQRTTITSNWT